MTNHTKNMSPKRRKQKQETKTKTKAGAEAETQNLPYLPEPIVVHIISKLPVKSLLRFRCVSKSWCSLISDPKFSLTSKREQVMVMSMIFNFFPRKSYSALSFLVDAKKDYLVKKIPLPKQLKKGDLKIMGSCNGLLLLSNVDDLFLWNPSTRCCNRVLSYDKGDYMDDEYGFDSIFFYSVASGLCYDSALGIYKAVVALSDFNPQQHHVSVSVGCFKSLTWMEIPFPYSRHDVESGPTVNGCLHWMVIDSASNYRENFIVCYDPKMNEFVTMSMPPSWGSKKEVTLLGLGVLDGCLSVAFCCGDRSPVLGEFEVQAMKKYGDVTSWTSLFVIPKTTGLDCSWLLVPWCYMNKGEVLIQCDNIFLVDNSRTSCYRRFYVLGADEVNTIAFVESLDSPIGTTGKGSKKFYVQG